MLDALGDETLTEADIKERVGGNSTLTGKALRALCTDGSVRRTGEGKKGDPYLYTSVKSSILDFTPKAKPENETDDDLLDAVNF